MLFRSDSTSLAGKTAFEKNYGLDIGNIESGSNRYFNGSIDEVRIYDRALSASEITELYNQGANRLAKVNVNQKTDVVGSGLVGYWTFDGQDTDWGANTVNDMSTNSNNGTITNMSTSTDAVSGIIGQALDFDGDNNYVDVPDSASLRVADGDFSVSFWLKRDAISSVIENLVGTENGVSNYLGWSIRLGGSDTISFYVNDGAGQKLAGGGEVLVVNEWYHFVGVVDSGNTIYYYLNGTLQDSTSLAGETAFEKNYGLDIGNIESGSNRYFNGSIDEVRMYNRALSASEITELYNQGAEKLLKVNMPQTDLMPNGLVGYWTFDGQDTNWGTNKTNDLSGNSNTGTMTSMSTSTSPVAGIVGQALEFDGTNDFVNISNSASLDITGSITVSVWFKAPNWVGSQKKSILSNCCLVNLILSLFKIFL